MLDGRLLAALCLTMLHSGAGAAALPRNPDIAIATTAGEIHARLYLDVAPVSTCNFLRYMIAGHYNGGRFFRTVRRTDATRNPVPIDVIQASARDGEETDAFGPIPLERTSVTGLTHRAGALSMARWGPDTATSSFSIVVRASPEMDFGGRRNSDGQGFAVFGQVRSGMRVVRAIQNRAAIDEKLVAPVGITHVRFSGYPEKDRLSVVAMCKIARATSGPVGPQSQA